MKGRLLLTFACLALSHAVLAADSPVWRRQADAIVDGLAKDAPGGVVVISQGGQVVYASARGLASVELAVPLQIDSAFRIGSLTKTVTAASILRLNKQGRIDLDANLSTWYPDFPRSGEISVRQLLSHTSGVSDDWDAPLTDVLDTPGTLRRIGSVPLDFAPGTDWRYSNSGYMLLGAILEKITGKPWYEAETQLVLAPLGLTHTAFRDDRAIVPHMAAGYSVDASGHVVRPVAYSITGPGAAGGLTSTATDIVTLLHGLATGPVWGKDAFQAMSTPARIGDVTLPYGLGVVPGDLRGTPAVEHSGGIEGYSAHYIYLAGSDIAVAVLENSDAPPLLARSLARRLAAVALGRAYRSFTPATWDASHLNAVAGTYAIEGGGCHSLTIRNGSAWIRRDGGPERQLETHADDVLTYAGDGIDYLHLVHDGAGKVVALEFHPDGADSARRERRVGEAECAAQGKAPVARADGIRETERHQVARMRIG